MTTTSDEKKKTLAKITPSKEDYFMGVLIIESSMCRDPYGQQAALIVDGKNRQVSMGVNHIPTDNHLKKLGWDDESRYMSMVTAVESAIDRALKLYLVGSTYSDPFSSHDIYVTGKPTLRCVRRCLSLGLKNIIYGPVVPLHFDERDWEYAKKLADAGGITMKKYNGNLNWLRDKIESLSDLFSS